MANIKLAEESLMGDQRHEELLKAASECIGLMNVGVDGDIALAKVAEETDMNDHEVELVAHAVNNSKQVAHLQTSKPEDREKPFPLINVDSVKDLKANKLQPDTNAEVNTGDRYAPQEEMGDTTAIKQSAPDAVQINKKVIKDAQVSYTEAGDYRRVKVAEDGVAKLREAWGIVQPPHKYPTIPENPYLKIAVFDIGIDEARTRAAGARIKCLSLISKLANEFRRVDAPSFIAFEKAANAAGVSADLVDLIYESASLGKFNVGRADLTKTASNANIYVSDRVYDLVKESVRADTFLKEAIDTTAAGMVLESKKKLAADKGGGKDGVPSEWFSEKPFDSSVSFDIGQIGKEIEEYPEAVGGLSPELLEGAMDAEQKTPSSLKSVFQATPSGFKHELDAYDVRASINELMQDQYISGHDLSEVVEAYNAAMSVNPRFSKAELISYVRQHLATQGAVPLDLQLRAAANAIGSAGGSQDRGD